MARRFSGNKRGRRERQEQHVVIDNTYAGRDFGKVQRIISHAQNSESMATIVIGAAVSIPVATTTSNTGLSFVTIASEDDFASMAAQFATFRVRAIMFDVYDYNPNVVGQAFAATFHQAGSNVPITFQNTVDRPDSQVIIPGADKRTFIWRPKGTLENEFQAVTGFIDFGGLAVSVLGGPAAAANKYQVLIKAVVDFRARL